MVARARSGGRTSPYRLQKPLTGMSILCKSSEGHRLPKIDLLAFLKR
jgi:hypothetical protein